jgi:hypothetical protein
MLLRRSGMHDQICVLQVSPSVLDIADVVVTDGNAGSKYVRFGPAPSGLALVDRERTFARWWAHPGDEIEKWRHSVEKCAEVLVPDVVPVQYITGAYVSCDLSRQGLQMLAPDLAITVDADLFSQ